MESIRGMDIQLENTQLWEREIMQFRFSYLCRMIILRSILPWFISIRRVKLLMPHHGGEIEKLVKKGYVVAAADVIGIGETKNTAARGITDGYTAVLIGRSVVGIQAGDILRVVNYLKSCQRN